jgi:hypothetical protein
MNLLDGRRASTAQTEAKRRLLRRTAKAGLRQETAEQARFRQRRGAELDDREDEKHDGQDEIGEWDENRNERQTEEKSRSVFRTRSLDEPTSLPVHVLCSL